MVLKISIDGSSNFIEEEFCAKEKQKLQLGINLQIKMPIQYNTGDWFTLHPGITYR